MKARLTILGNRFFKGNGCARRWEGFVGILFRAEAL